MKMKQIMIIFGIFFLLFAINFIQAERGTDHLTNVYFCTQNGWEFSDSVQYGSIYYCTDSEDTHYRFPESNVDKCLSYRPTCEISNNPIYCSDFNGFICNAEDECMGERIIAKDTDGSVGDGIKCCELGCRTCDSSGCELPNSNSNSKSNQYLFLIMSVVLVILLGIIFYFFKIKKHK